MNVFGEPWITRHTTYFSNPNANPEALLNDATEWLQYAHNQTRILAELVHEKGHIEARSLTTILEGIAAFIDMGMRCATQAHLKMQWCQVQAEAGNQARSSVVGPSPRRSHCQA